MLDAIRRADVAILVIDATEPVSSVDRKLAAELVRLAKPTLLVVNKTDLVDPAEAGAEKFAEYLAKELKAFNFAPIVFAAAAKVKAWGTFTVGSRQRQARSEWPRALEHRVRSHSQGTWPFFGVGDPSQNLFCLETPVHPDHRLQGQ